MRTSPIGIFDSGLGGLSIWQEIVRNLPQESTIYFADQANCPYGNKANPEITRLTRTAVEFLQQKYCKLIVIACNSATAAAIQELRESYNLPFVGIEPAIKPAAARTQTGNIGVLATQRTLEGRLFQQTKAKHAQHVEVLSQIGEGLVELVENGEYESPKAYQLLQKYLAPMLAAQVDQIVLGCTHYPFLNSVIQDIVQNQATILNPAAAVARQVKRILTEQQLRNQVSPLSLHHFYSTSEMDNLKNFVDKIKNVPSEQLHFASLQS